MIVLAIVIGAVIAVAVVPVLILLCADSSDGTPKLNSVKKKQSKKTANGSTRKKRESDGLKDESTVIANSTAAQSQAQVEAAKGNDVSAHAYEDPENLTQAHQAKEINAVLSNGSSTSPKASVVNETSPVSSRSSRASNGQSRVVSQERALPEIPGANNNNRLSLNTERSPSTKRALPELPQNTAPAQSVLPSAVSTLEDDGADHYDQLERDLLPHQMRSKTSESASVKSKTKTAVEGDNDSVEMIVPDEVTRSSVFMSTNPHEVYSVVQDEEPTPSSSEQPEVENQLRLPGSIKVKGKAEYSKVKKSAAADSRTSTYGDRDSSATEPIYADPPPVPEKLCDVEVELTAPNEEGAAAGAVTLVIDNNAQDSGSGYYAVTDDGPAPAIAVSAPHLDLPASYDILTGRESIASVRARQTGADAEEDHYEAVDEKPGGSRGASGGAAVASLPVDGAAMELYAEIDNQQPTAPKVADGTKRPAIIKSAFKEDLYAEIDEPIPSTSKAAGAKGSSSLRPARQKNHGYEKVDFSNGKGKGLDPADHSIVTEAKVAVSQNPPAGQNDEEDYAECDSLPTATLQVGAEHLSRHASDVSDYATVNYNSDSPAPTPQPEPQSSAAADAEQRPFQKYKRKEHLYQEIDEVGERKSPPDKQ